MARYEVKRRTFEASKHPAGSPERAELNRTTLTSEYMPSLRYMLFCYRDDGTLATTDTFRTKSEAETVMNSKMATASK